MSGVRIDIGIVVVLVIGIVLGVIVGVRINTDKVAMGQFTRGASAGGIMAFTGQIGKDTYGIIMIDVDAGTLWVYQYRRTGQLKLVAARSWVYDRYLEEYNCAPPTPSEVAQIVADKQQVEPPAKSGVKLESKE